MPRSSTKASPKPARAFCAHINAFIWSVSLNVPVRTGISQGEGDQIKALTLSRLQKSAKGHDWTPADVDVKGVLLVCPKLYDYFQDSDESGEEPKKPGCYVVDAIGEFLGRPPGLLCDSDSEGFVVNHDDGKVWKIEAQTPPEHKGSGVYGLFDERFEAVEERPGEDWKVFMKRYEGRKTYAEAASMESD